MRNVILLVGLLLLPLVGFANEDKEAEGPVIEYVDMQPKFTVNLAEPKKYLLVNVQLLVEGADSVGKVKKHLPMLRHELIMMLSGMHVADLQTMEQREALRVKAKELMAVSLAKVEVKDGFKDLFFSEFLVN
jgi:flagellar FliL protein